MVRRKCHSRRRRPWWWLQWRRSRGGFILSLVLNGGTTNKSPRYRPPSPNPPVDPAFSHPLSCLLACLPAGLTICLPARLPANLHCLLQATCPYRLSLDDHHLFASSRPIDNSRGRATKRRLQAWSRNQFQWFNSILDEDLPFQTKNFNISYTYARKRLVNSFCL